MPRSIGAAGWHSCVPGGHHCSARRHASAAAAAAKGACPGAGRSPGLGLARRRSPARSSARSTASARPAGWRGCARTARSPRWRRATRAPWSASSSSPTPARAAPRCPSACARAATAAGSWAAGEALAWGSGRQATPRGIVYAWMHSPPHRAVLLGRKYRDVGIGVALGSPFGASSGEQRDVRRRAREGSGLSTETVILSRAGLHRVDDAHPRAAGQREARGRGRDVPREALCGTSHAAAVTSRATATRPEHTSSRGLRSGAPTG